MNNLKCKKYGRMYSMIINLLLWMIFGLSSISEWCLVCHLSLSDVYVWRGILAVAFHPSNHSSFQLFNASALWGNLTQAPSKRCKGLFWESDKGQVAKGDFHVFCSFPRWNQTALSPNSYLYLRNLTAKLARLFAILELFRTSLWVSMSKRVHFSL